MKFRMLCWVVVLLTFVACGKSHEQKQAEEELHKAVMELHDEIMVQQKEMNQLNNYLSARVNKYGDYPNSTQMASVLILMDSTETAMRDWMRNYRKYDPQKPHDEVMRALKNDQAILLKIKADTEKAIQLGKDSYDDHEQFLKKKKYSIYKEK